MKLIWSVSADRTWRRCQRQFYFDEIMASATAKDPLRQKAHFLGQLQQLTWWPGRIVHVAVEKLLLPQVKAGRWPKAESLISEVDTLARRQFSFSESGKYRTISRASADSDYCVLAPHYFGKPIDEDNQKVAFSTISNALGNLLQSNRLRDFMLRRQWYRTEQPLYMKIDGTSVRAVPDLLMPPRHTLGLDVVDWKVGSSPSSYHFQIAIYAMAAQHTDWLAGYARANVSGYVVNLLKLDPAVAFDDPYTVDEDVLTTTANTMYESIEQIRAVVGNKTYGELEAERFEYANSTGTCALCNWRELCVEIDNESPAKSLPGNEPRTTQLQLPFD